MLLQSKMPVSPETHQTAPEAVVIIIGVAVFSIALFNLFKSFLSENISRKIKNLPKHPAGHNN